MTHYPVYIIRTHLAMPDPDLPSPRYHTAIFVEIDPVTGSGTINEVTGDITSPEGMYCESKLAPQPESVDNIFSRTLLGMTDEAHYPNSWDNVLRDIPAPPQQKAFNVT
ncbi:Fungal specific transcription factor domain family protein [Aspergillus niger]|uniref:Fungal specific transcription factor domain family protein n=1 Tax=Aspergillus niger TaxID=5061 RepID=A0A505IK32_ASPNG|nr:Fungal specific transcription factor domain family protein [Aspergillus niger]